jgi:hypothetical protein
MIIADNSSPSEVAGELATVLEFDSLDLSVGSKSGDGRCVIGIGCVDTTQREDVVVEEPSCGGRDLELRSQTRGVDGSDEGRGRPDAVIAGENWRGATGTRLGGVSLTRISYVGCETLASLELAAADVASEDHGGFVDCVGLVVCV